MTTRPRKKATPPTAPAPTDAADEPVPAAHSLAGPTDTALAGAPVGTVFTKTETGYSVHVPKGNDKTHGVGASIAAALHDATG